MTDQTAREPTLYESYFEGGRQAFWAWQPRWRRTRMLVRSFGEPTAGPPYYGNPRADFEVWCFDETAGWVQAESLGEPSWGTFNWLRAPCGVPNLGDLPSPPEMAPDGA